MLSIVNFGDSESPITEIGKVVAPPDSSTARITKSCVINGLSGPIFRSSNKSKDLFTS